jgi:hypothetical protein
MLCTFGYSSVNLNFRETCVYGQRKDLHVILHEDVEKKEKIFQTKLQAGILLKRMAEGKTEEFANKGKHWATAPDAELPIKIGNSYPANQEPRTVMQVFESTVKRHGDKVFFRLCNINEIRPLLL